MRKRYIVIVSLLAAAGIAGILLANITETVIIDNEVARYNRARVCLKASILGMQEALQSNGVKVAGVYPTEDQQGMLADVLVYFDQNWSIPMTLSCAYVSAESEWNISARGTSGEWGLMQVLPETAIEVGTWMQQDTQMLQAGIFSSMALKDPADNLSTGLRYLAHCRNWVYTNKKSTAIPDAAIIYNAGFNGSYGIMKGWYGYDKKKDLLRYGEKIEYYYNNYTYGKYNVWYYAYLKEKLSCRR